MKKIIIEASMNRNDQIKKMDAWHNGTRNENVKAMGDAKLWMNYDICMQKGYVKEADILFKQALNNGAAWAVTMQHQMQNTAKKLESNPIEFVAMDFHQADASFVKDHLDSPETIVKDIVDAFGDGNEDTKKHLIIDLIYAVLLDPKSDAVTGLMNELTVLQDISKDDIKVIMKNCLADTSIKQRLEDIINSIK